MATVISKNELASEHQTYQLDLTGIYQLKNVVSVIESIEQLHAAGWPVTHDHLHAALPHVKKLTGLYGRWQVLQQHPTVIADVGHNEDGIKQIVQQLELTSYNHLQVVLGFVKDKEVTNVLKLLPKTATYYFTKAQIERAMPEDILKQMGEENGLTGHSYIEVNEALQQAIAKAQKDDLVLICGSVFLVGEVNLL
jgi:dihydrofolate synthase/folylpolyglutamate synthase